MNKYIEQNVIIETFKKYCPNPTDLGNAQHFINIIKNIPAANVRPVVRGKWICGDYWSEGCGMGESYGFYYECSVCKDVVQGGYKDCGMKYCPNCGADMRGE